MKRLLIVTMLALMTAIGGYSQSSLKYHTDVMGGYNMGFGNWSAGGWSLHTIQGVLINPWIAAGLGLGIDQYAELSGAALPIYVSVKGMLPTASRFTPFVSAGGGYCVGLSGDISGRGGLYWSADLGLKYRKFAFKIGVKSQHSSWQSMGYDMRGVRVMVGLAF